ncbi:MAG: HAD-IA family hydrolase [Cellvibrionaceae bacterium]|nr:HAD-IA family hydrolase [Cellvibrionaceae bacterium]
MTYPQTLIIFDWDGTLSDSTAKIIQCVQDAAITARVPVRATAAILDIIGLGLPEAIERLYPELTPADQALLRKHYVDSFLSRDQAPSPFFEGVRDGLQQLSAAGFTLAIATGKSRRGLDQVLSTLQMTDVFHGSRCADETASKPDPQMLLELLAQFSVSADAAVMVGDTEYDMAMAEAIHMPRAAVSYGAHALSRLQAYDPVCCVDQFTDLVDYLLCTTD